MDLIDEIAEDLLDQKVLEDLLEDKSDYRKFFYRHEVKHQREEIMDDFC